MGETDDEHRRKLERRMSVDDRKLTYFFIGVIMAALIVGLAILM